MRPWDPGVRRSRVCLAGALLALLVGTFVPACGDGAAEPGDGHDTPDGESSDAGDGLDEDGGSGAPCELDFDCAVGEACREGFCAETSPDGWCPRIFERPLRRRVLDGLMSGPIGRCGPRCLMGAGLLVEDDPSSQVRVIRRREESGVTETSYPTEPAHGRGHYPHLALFEDEDGAVLSATYVVGQPHRTLRGRRVETPAVFPQAERNAVRRVRGRRGRFQDGDGLLHLFFSSAGVGASCFGRFEENGEVFELLQSYCLPDPGEGLDYGPADAMFRTDGGIDVVAGLGPWNGQPIDQFDATWLDGWDPGAADPLLLAPGAGPQLCLAPDGSSVLGLNVWIAGPVRPLLDRTDLLWLGPSGAVERTLPAARRLAIVAVRLAGRAVSTCRDGRAVLGGSTANPSRWRSGATARSSRSTI